MPNKKRVRRVTDAADLTADQRKQITAAARAQRKLESHDAKRDELLAARADAVRAALANEVGVELLARELGVSSTLLWKINEGVTTKELAARRARKR